MSPRAAPTLIGLRALACALLTSVALWLGNVPLTASASADRPWIFAADIHLDPTGRYGRGRIGSDTNPELLASTIREMQRVDPAPPVIVLGGDFLAHVFDSKQAVPTIRALAAQFNRAFPNAQFLFMLGNEDSDCGDYTVPAHSTFLRSIAKAWEPLVNRHGAAPDFARTFPVDGFYVARLPRTGLRAAVIDDVFWSPRYRNACNGAARPGQQTQRDLEAALHARPLEKTWVFAHIPPGIDAFSTAHLAHGLVIVPFLDQAAKDTFVGSVTAPHSPVTLIVAAHTHKFAFRIAGAGQRAVPMLLVPAISPIFGNAPSFLTVHVDAASTIVSAENWTRLDGRWADRGGLPSLGMADISVRSILAFQRRLADDSALRTTFALLYNGGAPPEITAANWRIYWCAATDLSATTFRACMAEGGISILTTRGIKVIIVIAVALVAIGLLIVRFARRSSKRRGVASR